MIHIRPRRIVACLLAVAVAGCGETQPRPTAQIQATANPSPITPIACPVSSCGQLAGQLEAITMVTVRETAGVAGTVQSIAGVLRRNSDNVQLAAGTITPPAGRFAANGSIEIQVGFHYEQAQGSAAATLTLTVNARDDNDHQVSATVTVPVAGFTP